MKNLASEGTICKQCYICQRDSCQESYTHMKIDKLEFKRLLTINMKYSRKVELVRSAVKKLFKAQRETTQLDLDIAEMRVINLLDIIHYWHLVEKLGKLDNLLSILIDGEPIPSAHQMHLIFLELKEVPVNFKEFSHFQLIYKFIRQSEETLRSAAHPLEQVKLSITKTYIETGFKQVLKIAQKIDIVCRAAPIPLQNHISVRKESEVEDLIYIANIPISALRQQMNLSMLRLKDQDILNYGNTLRGMKYLRSLQARNSCMSAFGIKVLCNCLPNLNSLDIRNSNLSHQSISALVDRLPKLEYLYISQNNVDDDLATRLSQKLQKLVVLYIDGNNVTMRGADRLIDGLRNLRILSLQNNDISDIDGWRLRSKFCRRGGHLEV